jgi:hypothetical protein
LRCGGFMRGGRWKSLGNQLVGLSNPRARERVDEVTGIKGLATPFQRLDPCRRIRDPC